MYCHVAVEVILYYITAVNVIFPKKTCIILCLHAFTFSSTGHIFLEKWLFNVCDLTRSTAEV